MTKSAVRPRNWKAMREDRVLAMAQNRFGRMFASKDAAISALAKLPVKEQRSLKKVALSVAQKAAHSSAARTLVSGMSAAGKVAAKRVAPLALAGIVIAALNRPANAKDANMADKKQQKTVEDRVLDGIISGIGAVQAASMFSSANGYGVGKLARVLLRAGGTLSAAVALGSAASALSSEANADDGKTTSSDDGSGVTSGQVAAVGAGVATATLATQTGRNVARTAKFLAGRLASKAFLPVAVATSVYDAVQGYKKEGVSGAIKNVATLGLYADDASSPSEATTSAVGHGATAALALRTAVNAPNIKKHLASQVVTWGNAIAATSHADTASMPQPPPAFGAPSGQPAAYLNSKAESTASTSSVSTPTRASGSQAVATPGRSDGMTEGYTRSNGVVVPSYRTPKR
jgi:hypothetical protein